MSSSSGHERDHLLLTGRHEPKTKPARPGDHWIQHARQWSLVRPPLRPCPADLAVVRDEIDSWVQSTGCLDTTLLVLGVTPELCRVPVRGNSRFIAVDKSAAMTRTWWQPRSGSRDEALLADWRSVPIESASIDIVLADGSLCLVPFPDGCREILVEMQRLLRPGGRWIMRCFARPEQRETCARVFQELDDGLIGSFHILKWRLAMALQNDSESGIAIGRIFEEVANRFEQLDDLAACCGWPLEEVRTLEAYRGVSTRYFFPTLSEHVGVLEEEGFVVERMVTPDYELGDRCPTLVLSALR